MNKSKNVWTFLSLKTNVSTILYRNKTLLYEIKIKLLGLHWIQMCMKIYTNKTVLYRIKIVYENIYKQMFC